MKMPESGEKFVESKVRELSEFFPNVQIIVTRPVLDGSGGTERIAKGCGDWFARQGATRNWLELCRHQEMAEEIQGVLSPPDDEEGWRSDS